MRLLYSDEREQRVIIRADLHEVIIRAELFCRRCSRCKFPFRKRLLPFSRHLEIFLPVNEFFSTKLKKKENLQVAT